MKSAPKTALVTGAGGIGAVTAMEFARRGYRVAICDIDEQGVHATATAIREAGGEVESYVCDISARAEVELMFKMLKASFGRLDAAFNNAGLGSGKRIGLAEVTEENWQRMIDVNLTGTWRCLKHEINWMLQNSDPAGGCIVNMGSVFSINGFLGAPYTATKHGIAGLTKSAAIAYAAMGIRVNAVCPGLIDAGMGAKALAQAHTDQQKLFAMHPANRAGTAQEVANAVLWLCSEEASFTHGHLLTIDGGYSSH